MAVAPGSRRAPSGRLSRARRAPASTAPRGLCSLPKVNLVDALIVVVVVLAAVHGVRRGFLLQVFSFGGFWLGVVLGVLLAAPVLGLLHSTLTRAVVAILLIFGLGVLVGIVGQIAGERLSAAFRRHHLGPADAVAGAAVAVVAALFTVWLAGSILATSRFTALNSAVQDSSILRALDKTLPPLPDLFSRVQSFLSGQGFPTVFAGLAPFPATPVAVPPPAQTAAIAAPAKGSVVKILGEACGYEIEGSAFVVAPGLVATNAHVVAGEQQTEVVTSSGTYRGTVVYYDPSYDMALVRTSAPLGPPLVLDTGTVARGTAAAVIGYPEGGPLTVNPAGVAATLVAEGRDIYGGGLVVRSIYEIDAQVRPGNSGGPLVIQGGEVIGMVFSRSTVDPGVGYALTASGVEQRVQQASGAVNAVSTGACVPG